MKARLHFDMRHRQISFDVSNDVTFEVFCDLVQDGRKADAMYIGPKMSVPMRHLSYIENLEA